MVPDGTAGCVALFEEVQVRDYSDFRYARVYRKMVDTYCLQHPDRYCASAKSFAAHLTGSVGRSSTRANRRSAGPCCAG